MALKDVEFFGVADRKSKRNPDTNELEPNPDGRITSAYPAWTQRYQIEEMQEDIARQERELARPGVIDPASAMEMKDKIKRQKARLASIEKSKPKLSAVDKDKIAKSYESIGKEIQDAQFTYSDMMKGTASAHEEADRMVEKRIPLERAGLSPDMAKQLNIRPKSGKVSRNDLSKAFKIYGHLLGESTNVETLRRDRLRPTE